MMKKMQLVLSVLCAGYIAVLLWIVSCDSKGTVSGWVPTIDSFNTMPFRKTFVLRDKSNQYDFEVSVGTADRELFKGLSANQFELEVLPVDGSLETDGAEAGVGLDGNFIPHESLPLQDEKNVGPPKLFVKVHAVGDEEPPRFVLRTHNLPVTKFTGVVNAGHYKSIVLRKSTSSWAYAKFYHHHGDGKLHILYQGWFTRCTYAYDCYPNHSIPSWECTANTEIEYRADCYGRCP